MSFKNGDHLEEDLPLDIVASLGVMRAEEPNAFHARLRTLLRDRSAPVPSVMSPPPIPPRSFSSQPNSPAQQLRISTLTTEFTPPKECSTRAVSAQQNSTHSQVPSTSSSNNLFVPVQTEPTSTPQHEQWNLKDQLGPFTLNQRLVRNTTLPTFIGVGDQKCPQEFLMEMERYARSQGIPLTAIVTLLPAALIDDAYRWWAFMGGFRSWEEFKTALHTEYDQPDFHSRLQAELEQRTQHPEEPLSAYIRVIANYYERLGSNASDSEKVARVLRQMHPQFYPYFHGRNFANLHALAAAAPEVQVLIWRQKTYQPPVVPAEAVAKDLSFGPTSLSTSSPHTGLKISNQNSSRDRTVCWECGSKEHFKRNCPTLPKQGNGMK